MRSLLISFLGVALAVSTPITAQQPTPASPQSPAEAPTTVIRTTTRMVVLDVVATDKRGNPVTDLKATDFTVLEKDKEQTIKSFSLEQPASAPGQPSASPSAIKFPPNVFSNIKFTQVPKTLNVILLDALNTTVPNQSYVRQQMINLLDTMPAGQLTAVYTLNDDLRLLQDFTSDPQVLKQVAKNFRPQRSFVPDNATGGPRDELLSPGALVNNPLAAGIQQSMTRFLANKAEYNFNTQFRMTSQALQAIAHMLAAYTGRKNIIWISGGFPLRFLPENGKQRDTCGEPCQMLRNTYNTLVDTRVAVYPVDATGLVVVGLRGMDAGYDSVGNLEGHPGPAYARVMSSQYDQFAETHRAMEDMAARTGGKAFYNRNDVGMAIQNGITDGSTYYLVGYYPSDKNWNGDFRKLQVKVNRPGINLRYRPGYYAIDKQGEAQDSKSRNSELVEAMSLSTPPSTMLFFTATLAPPSAQAANKLVVNYSLDAHAINFEQSADGLRHASVGCYVRAFKEDGTPVKAARQLPVVALTPDIYQLVMKAAFPCNIEMELPPGKYLLRFAARDERTGMMGTADGSVTIPQAEAAQAH